MRSPEPAELLDIWERGRPADSVARGLQCLRAAWPEIEPAAFLAMPVIEWDLRVLEVHETWFGPSLDGQTNCPSCDEALELAFRTDALRAAGAERAAGGPERSDRDRGRGRVPSMADLVAAGDCGDPASARRVLVQRCTGTDAEVLSEEGVASPATEVAGATADLHVTLTCAACGHRWECALDPLPFLWSAIEAWAERMLYDVHRLASAHGWTESQVLGLSPARRRRYLEWVPE